ncbi:protein phosphatase CheZ [Helicobacter ailurogastricus]|uniref:protein phosphatase CheZ n=1 Tax=Helicobacter ailurogastricus TaxID=1578720 RepID=UPI0022C581F5|nr:protein phosphatase CheZ [Helicobacter ailurogastricus]GLH57344.1 Chemotaxis protein [Helicobacter ailurogastricus]GLH60049.1 Chemotaxis protein [Helicobacter ailurogastricus]
MTQEELDALMSGGGLEVATLELEKAEQEEEIKGEKEIKGGSEEESQEAYEAEEDHGMDQHTNMKVDKKMAEKYGKIDSEEWPPPPPTEEHKVVHQLDDVTRDSEVKATQIFDQLDYINMSADGILKALKKIKTPLQKHLEIFEVLAENFPLIQTFQTSLDETNEILQGINSIQEKAEGCSDSSMQAMDIMQFQDIHRQKIERVINVMRALTQYMNALFEGSIADSKRVSSASYIIGDDNESAASESDIEALIAAFGKK